MVQQIHRKAGMYRSVGAARRSYDAAVLEPGERACSTMILPITAINHVKQTSPILHYEHWEQR